MSSPMPISLAFKPVLFQPKNILENPAYAEPLATAETIGCTYALRKSYTFLSYKKISKNWAGGVRKNLPLKAEVPGSFSCVAQAFLKLKLQISRSNSDPNTSANSLK
jgi:hypothetical protein